MSEPRGYDAPQCPPWCTRVTAHSGHHEGVVARFGDGCDHRVVVTVDQIAAGALSVQVWAHATRDAAAVVLSPGTARTLHRALRDLESADELNRFLVALATAARIAGDQADGEVRS
jgi:hypothetical protein